LKTIDEMRVVVGSVGKSVNVIIGFTDPSITLEQLAKIGVRRVSIGVGVSRVVLNTVMTVAQAMKDGHFEFIRDMIGVSDLRKTYGEVLQWTLCPFCSNAALKRI
jgi:2-methylisocitrate lyase-like PEP mutase family enzyme